MSIAELQQAFAEERTPEEVVNTHLTHIENRDGEINAFTDVYDDKAVKTSRAATQSDAPLHGIPIALKDLGMPREGDVITSGSQIMASASEPSETTTIFVERLEQAGAIVLGRTNTPEFGYGGVRPC